MAKKLRSEQVDLANYYSKTESTPLIQGSNITITETEEGVVISSSGVPASHTHSASDITSGIFNIARIPTGTSGTTVSLGNHLHTGVYEPVFTKNAAFNKNFGTAAGTVAQGNDARLSDARTPLAHNQAISTITGLQSALDSKQDTLEPGSNITITDSTISAVDTTYGVATTSANGLMSSADKSKLNGIAAGANNYSLPTASATVLGGIKVGSRLTISSGTLSANVQSDNNFTSAYKTKLDGIEAEANKYVHPTSAGNKHIPTGGAANQILRYSASGTAVWSAENNTTYVAVTTSANGLMIAADKEKLDGIEEGANNYVHPSGIYMSSAERTKLAGIAASANNYSLPTASGTVLGGIKVGTRLSISNGVLSATQQTANDFTTALKDKLDGIAAGANNYVHPTSHPASMITGLHASATTGVAGSVAWGNVSGKPSTFAPSAHTLGSHSDVTITSIASGEILKWDGTKWINNTLSEAGISASSHSHSWSQITSKPSTFAPSAHTHTSAQISDATDLNTASMIVKRDSSGNFSAGTITASLSGNASTATTATNCGRSVVAGSGLTGGGALSANRTLTLGTPSTLTNATSNGVTTDSHTHAITTTTVGAANTIVATDASGGVRGNIIRIGANWTLELSGTELVFKYSGAIKQRMLSNGTILGTGGVTALATN